MPPRIKATVLLAMAGLLAPSSAPAQQLETGGREATEAQGKLNEARAKLEAKRKDDLSRRVLTFRTAGLSGLVLAEVSEAIRSQVGLPEGQGAVIVAVRALPSHPVAKAKLQPNDLILQVGSDTVTGVARAHELLARPHKEPVAIKIIRGGKEETLTLDPADPRVGEKTQPLVVRPALRADPSAYWIGVPVSPVDATLRSHLAELPPEAGLIVNDVVKDSPAAKAGLAKNDVLIAIGGKPLTSVDVLTIQVWESEGKELALDYLRGGKKATVSVTPEKREVTTGEMNSAYRFEFKAIPDIGRMMITPDMAARVAGADTKALTIEIDEAVKGLNAKIAGVGSVKNLDSAIKDLTAKVEEIRKSVDEIKRTTDELKRPDRK